MKRIFFSALVILAAGFSIYAGATGAFFSDSETSRNNTLGAGDIDLKVDNESYYNGLVSTTTSWEAKDLTIEKFFDFHDVKPSDYGEDTISLRVDTNDAYLCADVTLTSNEENGQTEPERDVDETTGAGEGELAGLVEFIWWADDGDNVLEDSEEESVISSGPLGALAIGEAYPLALADSDESIWGDAGPISGGTTYYIGKAWCFGSISPSPLPEEGYDSPAHDNNDNDTPGEPEDGGFSCNGSGLGNESQTDTLTADISFSAVQARHNANFQCDEPLSCEPSETNIFVNGGFESPEVTDAQQWQVFSAAISQWTIAWRSGLPTTFSGFDRPEPGNFELHEGVLGAAHSGDQYLELDSDWNGHNPGPNGEPSSTVISQTIATVPGATYTIDYWFAARPNTPAGDNVVEVRWNGDLIDTAGPRAGGGSPLSVGDWTQEGPIQVIATGNSATISFTDAGTANSEGSFIDDVSVTQTICPQQ